MVEQIHALHTGEVAWKSVSFTVPRDVSEVEPPSKVEADFLPRRWNAQACVEQGKQNEKVNLHLLIS